MADQVIVVPTPINPVQIKGAIAYSAEHARIWAEGSDEQVEELGGEHSAKGWAEATGEEGREYTDQKVAEAKQEMTNEINRQSLITLSQAESYADASVSAEAGIRADADANLQTQIDGLAAASDVKDIVGTYAELQSYDTSTLGDNDIIKVLDDSTHGDAPSYYRWDTDTNQFEYIGSESASYTKAQADAKFLTQTDAATDYVTYTAQATALADKANNADGQTIVDNGSAITTVAVKEQRANAIVKQWVGTQEQYEAIDTPDSNTLYITDGLDTQAIVVDDELSPTSTNPVQNKVIYDALQNVGGGLPDGTVYVPAVLPNFEVFDRSNPYTTTKPEVTLLQEAYSFTADANIRIPNVIAQVNNVTSFDIYTAILILNSQGAATDGIITILPAAVTNNATLRVTKDTSHHLRFRVSFLGNGTDDIDITATTTLTMATKYYLHISYSSTDGYKVLVKTANDTNWTELISSSLTTGISSEADNIDFGRNGTAYFRGVVYMRDTYINVNGQRAFNAVNIGKVPMIMD